MTGTPRSALADTLNRVLGLKLADFAEARVFLCSPEGDALLEAWLSPTAVTADDRTCRSTGSPRPPRTSRSGPGPQGLRRPLFDSPSREAADNVRELYRLRDLVDELIDTEIIRARELGAPWDLLGSSRQQAQQRAARVQRRQRALTNRAPELRNSSTGIDETARLTTVSTPQQPDDLKDGRHDRTARS